MNKMWKVDGEEQKFLEKLFREKEVNGATKPGDVLKKYPIFVGFTSATFRKHWLKTKLMFAPNIPGRHNDENDDIIEIDGTAPSPLKAPKLSTDEGMSTNILFKQAPITSTVYTDPGTKQDICLVVLSLYSRVKQIDFDIVCVEDSHVLKVTYTWPVYSYTASEMFKKEGSADTFVNKLHPKYLAVEKALESVRENIEDAPLGTIEIKLPATVQLDPSTWKNYTNKKTDGTLLIFLEFLCVRSYYIIKKAEKTILLD